VPYDDQLEQILLLRETLSEDGNLLSGLRGTPQAYEISAPFTNTFDDAGCSVSDPKEKEVCAIAHCTRRLEILRRFPCAKSFFTGEVEAGSSATFTLTAVGIILIFTLVAATVPCALHSFVFGRTRVELVGDKNAPVQPSLSRSFAGALARIVETVRGGDDSDDDAENPRPSRPGRAKTVPPQQRPSYGAPSEDDDLPGAAAPSESGDTYRSATTDLERSAPTFQRPTMKASDAYNLTHDAKFGRAYTLPGGGAESVRKNKKKAQKGQGIANSAVGEGSEVTGTIGANAAGGAGISKYGAAGGAALGGGLFF
jgi:hypothetical protein